MKSLSPEAWVSWLAATVAASATIITFTYSTFRTEREAEKVDAFMSRQIEGLQKNMESRFDKIDAMLESIKKETLKTARIVTEKADSDLSCVSEGIPRYSRADDGHLQCSTEGLLQKAGQHSQYVLPRGI